MELPSVNYSNMKSRSILLSLHIYVLLLSLPVCYSMINGQMLPPICFQRNYWENDETLSLKSLMSDSNPLVRPETCNNCMKRPYKFLIVSPDICKDASNNDAIIDLLILVTTKVDHIDRRRAIRQSWALSTINNTHQRVRYGFLFGFTSEEDLSLLKQENHKHKDVILQDFKEAYRNLTLKTLMAFEWANKYCPKYRIILKTDDDHYVHVRNILNLIDDPNIPEVKRSLSGACTGFSHPIRDRESRYFASFESYPHDVYPEFCAGYGYMMPREHANGILQISPNIPFFHLEDIYVGLCAKRLGYELTYLKGFFTWFTIDDCGKEGRENIYINEIIKPEHSIEMWQSCERDLNW